MQEVYDPYFDIRPYNDDEVVAAISRLINDDAFISSILQFRFPHFFKGFGWLLAPLLRRYLLNKWGKINTVHDVQIQVGAYMEAMLKNTSKALTVSGIEKLDKNKGYLFVSNHRDIALDPALVNYCLYINGLQTMRIAIGDNLLRRPAVTELMKLNKSFVVKRSISAPRERLKALTQLSAYIKDSLDGQHSIWIAQREGRAKDGNDLTDPAILKMFYMQGRAKKLDFAEYIASLNIVPIAISYENDPCDIAKANELYLKEKDGSYNKSEFEDINTIGQGIAGMKGRIHVSFGDVIDNSFTTPEALAAEIDRQVHSNYHLFPINYLSANIENAEITDDDRTLFAQKIASAPNEEIAKRVQNMYAQPTLNQLKISH